MYTSTVYWMVVSCTNAVWVIVNEYCVHGYVACKICKGQSIFPSGFLNSNNVWIGSQRYSNLEIRTEK